MPEAAPSSIGANSATSGVPSPASGTASSPKTSPAAGAASATVSSGCIAAHTSAASRISTSPRCTAARWACANASTAAGVSQSGSSGSAMPHSTRTIVRSEGVGGSCGVKSRRRSPGARRLNRGLRPTRASGLTSNHDGDATPCSSRGHVGRREPILGPIRGPVRKVVLVRLSSLLAVFAHPDDESLVAGGILAQHAAAGARTAVVTATWAPGTRRAAELADALRVLGAGEPRLLGYADAKVPESAPGQPRWCDAPLDEAVCRLVGQIRDFRPEGLVTFDALGGLTGHADHVHTHRVTVLAAEAAGLDGYPAAGRPWAPSIVYLATHPRSAVEAIGKILGTRGAVHATPDEQVTDRVTSRPGWNRRWPRSWPTAPKSTGAPFPGSSTACRRRPARSSSRPSGSSVALWRTDRCGPPPRRAISEARRTAQSSGWSITARRAP